MTASTTTASPSIRWRWARDLLDRDWFATVLAALFAVSVGFVMVRAPARVELELVNPSPVATSVAVRGGDDGWHAIATVGSDSRRVIEHVLDQGDTWTFRFRTRGGDAGELLVSRGDLERAGWIVEIPPPGAGDRPTG